MSLSVTLLLFILILIVLFNCLVVISFKLLNMLINLFFFLKVERGLVLLLLITTKYEFFSIIILEQIGHGVFLINKFDMTIIR